MEVWSLLLFWEVALALKLALVSELALSSAEVLEAALEPGVSHWELTRAQALRKLPAGGPFQLV